MLRGLVFSLHCIIFIVIYVMQTSIFFYFFFTISPHLIFFFFLPILQMYQISNYVLSVNKLAKILVC